MQIRRPQRIIAALICTLLLGGVASEQAAAKQCGKASWYALRGRTARGHRVKPSAMLAAHRRLPFGTRVRVEDRRTGRSVVVQIADRGPFGRGRIIDVSRAAARKLGFLRRGVARVCITVLSKDGSEPATR